MDIIRSYLRNMIHLHFMLLQYKQLIEHRLHNLLKINYKVKCYLNGSTNQLQITTYACNQETRGREDE